MIEINNLSKSYGDKKILNQIDLAFESGSITGIVGPNGAGKTTLIKILAQLIKPSNGEIRLISNSKNLSGLKEQIGYLGDESLLYEHLSPLENLNFFTKLYGLNIPEDKVIELINEVGLNFFRYDPIKTFSKGMIQRLAIARAIIHQPKILLLDEPYSGLDQKGIKLLNNIIRNFKMENRLILIITHDFEQAATLCDRIIHLNRGQIVDDFLMINKNKEFLVNRYESRVDAK